MKIVELFENDKERVNKFSKTIKISEDEFIYFDFSKTHVTEDLLNNYLRKIEDLDIRSKIQDMFEGKKINYTENREVLHVLLRDKQILDKFKESNEVTLEGNKVIIYEELLKIKGFVEKLSNKEIKGSTGKPIDTIVNIGIGGSDLGPKMVCDSLKHYSNKNINVKFISNIDASATIEVFKDIDPETALFIIVSKTFTTLETIKNMELSLKYLEEKLSKSKEEIFKHHFVAVSSNVEEVKKYNIQNIFSMWDFVGGRYSLWSAVGLSIAAYLGFDNFLSLLAGASAVDEQFRKLDGKDNIEIFHAIIEIYYSERNFNNKCIVSYDEYLQKLYLYLQQVEMESNGKYSDNNTGMIIWGGVGTDTQHSFFQLLHQGTRDILTEFLFPIKPIHNEKAHHQMIVSNCFAQSMALMKGKEGNKNTDFFSGNNPSISIGYLKLTPSVLGALLAHYEHKIFVQGIYWKINSFDQFGVALGKTIANDLLSNLDKDEKEAFDESTNQLMKLVKDNN